MVDMDSSGGMIVFIFMVFWVTSGFIGFGMSLVCFGYKGSTVEKVLGILLAFLFGPFYWIYYMASSTYCVK